MSDEPIENVEHEETAESNYKPPPMKSMEEIIKLDEQDESLQRYKETLLGGQVTEVPVPEPNDPRIVIVKSLALVVEGRPDIVLDLTGNLKELKKKVFTIKEGTLYRIKIDFIVQKEIVAGLKYVQKTTRKMIPADKTSHMVGSYCPKNEVHSFLTALEEAPQGMIFRGLYDVHSLFTDDDKNVHLEWDWCFEVKKDWE